MESILKIRKEVLERIFFLALIFVSNFLQQNLQLNVKDPGDLCEACRLRYSAHKWVTHLRRVIANIMLCIWISAKYKLSLFPGPSQQQDGVRGRKSWHL